MAAIPPDELERARKVAAMLSSDQTGEALNALSLLKRIADKHKLRVDMLLGMLGAPAATAAQPAPKPPPRPDPARQDDPTSVNGMVRLLGSIDLDRVTDWEQEFITNILERAKGPWWLPSARQSVVMQRLIDRYM